ncbi:MAG: DUF599 domain-containing protein [Polaromonas sp.]|nr:DUF599 domain-containing protein [Polaromonas sp.]
MNNTFFSSQAITWLAALATVLILLVYELAQWFAERQRPSTLARSAHANLREEWFAAISTHPGSEILAIQTLRNSLMSATMTASTAALGLVGAATLAAPSLNASFAATSALAEHFTARLALELTLMTLLFVSLVCSAMAVRYYNHVGFIVGMPVGAKESQQWRATGAIYLRRAGLLYSWGLRHLLMVAPILASIVYPLAGPVAALLVVMALYGFDRFTVR